MSIWQYFRAIGAPSQATGPVDEDAGTARRTSAGRKLDSWKEIADFLGVSVRTAHRWKDSSRMPVHRTPAGHVWADSSDLESWRRGLSEQRWRRWRVRAIQLTGIAGIVFAAGLFWFVDRPGPPTSARIDGQQLTTLDARNRTVWTTTIAQRLGFSGNWGWDVSTPDRYLSSDIDGDERLEVVLNLLPERAADGPGRLICYDDSGHVRWEFALGRAFRDRFGDYTLDYLGHIVRAVRIRGVPYVLSIATHRLWHPSQVALLDPRSGKPVEEFWHPGAITHALVADLNHDGTDELVLAGLNNPGPGPGSPALMALELPFSLHPTVPDSLMADVSDGGPTAYVLFPRADVLEAQAGMAAIAHVLFEEPDTLVARLRFTAKQSTNLTYRLDPELRVRDLFSTIDLASTHDLVAKTGALGHLFSAEEQAWLKILRRFRSVPDGNAERVPPFQPSR